MEELDLKEIFKMIWDSKKIVIVITIIMMIIAGTYSLVFQTPKYQSSTTLVLTKSENTEDSVTQTDVTMNQKLVSTYSEIIKSDRVLNQVIENLNLEGLTISSLKSSIKVKAVENTEVIRITVSNKNPALAAKIANEIGEVFSERVTEIFKLNNVYTLDEAKVSTEPYNIKPVKYVIIAFAVGVFVSCAYIIIKNLFDTAVKSTTEIEKALKIPVIAQIAYHDEIGKREEINND